MLRLKYQLTVAFIFLFTIVSPLLQSQTIRFVGHVLDGITNQPVDGAIVLLANIGKRETTNELGWFYFDQLDAGQYTLLVNHIAYGIVEQLINLSGNQYDTIFITMHPAIFQSNAVIVRSTRTLSDIGSTPYPLDVKLNDRLVQSSNATISEVLNKVPGIALVRDGTWETTVSIRGMSRSNIVSLIDNTRIETANDIAGALSLININDLERVETFKSSGSVLYGTGALGGVIHLITKRPSFVEQNLLKVEINSGITSINAGLSNYAAVEKLSDNYAVRVSGGYRSAGNTKTPSGILPNSQYQDFSLFGSLGIKTTGDQFLFITYQRSQAENTGIAGSSAFGETATARYTLARRELVEIEYNIPNISSSLSLLSIRASRQEITRNVEIIQSSLLTLTPHAVHTTMSAQIESKIIPAKDNILVLGIEIWERQLDSRREKNLINLDRVIGEKPIPASRFLCNGIYAQDEWNILHDNLILTLGTRYDWIRISNDITYNPEYVISSGIFSINTADSTILWKSRLAHNESWSATAGLQYIPNANMSVTFLAATAFRSPSLEERFQYLDLGNGNIQIGNPDLQPERSICLNTGLRVHIEDLKIQTDIFLNQLTNLISNVPGVFEGRPALIKRNIGEAQLYGFEISAEKTITVWLALKASISSIRGEDMHAHANLPQIPPLNGQLELSSYINSAGTLNVACSFFAAQNNLAAGEQHTPGYGILNMDFVSMPVNIAQLSLTFRCGVQNILDKAYRTHLSTLRGIIKDEPGRNLFLSVAAAL